MRAAFAILPAWFVALPALLIDQSLAAFLFVAFLGLGWHVTQPRPERGEHK